MLTHRTHLRRDITAEVQERLLSGALPVGRINESTLSAELGVSRTPLREALLVMEQRGLLQSAMGRGFLLQPLNREEASELYALLAVLQPMAVRLGIAKLQKQARKLDALLDAMAAGADHAELLELSARWGVILVECCPNRRLAGYLLDLLRLSARYERANLAQGFPVADALDTHRRIVATIAEGDGESAACQIAATWDSCLAALLRWLPAAPKAATTARRRRSALA